MEQYRINWKQYVERICSDRIPKQFKLGFAVFTLIKMLIVILCVVML
jgi:hypothetical protein